MCQQERQQTRAISRPGPKLLIVDGDRISESGEVDQDSRVRLECERPDEHIKHLNARGAGLNQSVLHVIVGHGLRTYFLNAVRSVRTVAPDDEILVVDNASPDIELRIELERISAADPRMRLLLRDSNDLANGKVGGLYDAYREAFALATEEGFEYLHLVQGDMQVLWWDDEVVSRAVELFEADLRCVNIYTALLSRDKVFGGEFEPSGHDDEVLSLRHYGLTDTGLYHLARWKELDMSFGRSEIEHARKYLAQGFTVLCHPWPTDAQIPWPAVVRWGVQRGKEIVPKKPFILRPLSSEEIVELKQHSRTWLEDVCIPWGWTCLTPMWTSHLDPGYWAARRQDAAVHGLNSSLPRWERRGLDGGRWRPFWWSQYRPSLVKLYVVIPLREIMSRLVRRQRSGPGFKSASPDTVR